MLRDQSRDVAPVEQRTGDEEVEQGGEREEQRDARGHRDVDEHDRLGGRGSGRPGHVGRRHRQGEVVREDEDEDQLDQMREAGDDVQPPQLPELGLLVGGGCRACLRGHPVSVTRPRRQPRLGWPMRLRAGRATWRRPGRPRRTTGS